MGKEWGGDWEKRKRKMKRKNWHGDTEKKEKKLGIEKKGPVIKTTQLYQSSRWGILWLAVVQRHGFGRVYHISGYGSQFSLPAAGAGKA